jgi:hypothetical protein
MVNTRRLTVLEEPFSLDLPYADRQRIVVLPNEVASLERQKRAKAGAELASRKRRHTLTPGQLVGQDHSQNFLASVNAEHQDVGSAFVEQLRLGAAEYEAAVLRGWGKLRNAGAGVREKIAAKASELAVRRRLGALLISRAEADMLRFDHGHPLEGVLYIRHPAQAATYYPAADFHRRVFEDKFVEAIKLLMSLGATRIAVQREEGFTREEAKIAVAPVGSRMKTGTEGGLSGALFEARLPGNSEPTVPPGLCWYDDEPTWRMIADARRGSGAEGTSLSVTYQTDYGIDKQLIGTARGVGLGLGGQFQEQKNTVWRLDADFMPLTGQ